MQNVPQDFLSEDWRAWILIHKFPLQLHCSQNVNSPALLCSFYPHRPPVTLEEKVLKHQRRMAGSVHKTVHHTWVEIKGRLRRCKTRNQAHLLQDDENWATITSFGAQHLPLWFPYSSPISFKQYPYYTFLKLSNLSVLFVSCQDPARYSLCQQWLPQDMVLPNSQKPVCFSSLLTRLPMLYQTTFNTHIHLLNPLLKKVG